MNPLSFSLPRSPAPMLILGLSMLLCTACGPDESSHRGEVIATDGRGGAPVGEQCTVQIRRATKFGLNCRISVVCGGVQLYGGKRLGGYASCQVDDDNRTTTSMEDRTSDRDGDPAIDLDIPQGTIKVWDRRWSTTLNLSAAG